MVNYSNGKIYKIEPIVEHLEGDIYIGSTTKKYLSQRMDKHRSSYKRYKDGKFHKFTVFDIFDKYGIDNCKIYLLESVNANSKDELLAKEGNYIKTLKCVNKCIVGRTEKEYYNDNKTNILKQQKDYYNNNKINILKNKKDYYNDNRQQKLEKAKEICICNICNCNYTKWHKSQHQKSQKHQNNLNKQNNLQK